MRATRRPLALTALTVLAFTGCSGQNTDPLPAPSGNSSSSSAPDASSSASASAVARGSERYSGGSKAPEGEYRPADELGPAQNVPKPVEPNVLNVESEEGLQNFIEYWTDSVNYGIQTGDFSIAESLISPDYEIEQEMYAWISEIYGRGGWVVGGRRDAILEEKAMTSLGEGRYAWIGKLNVENAQAYLDQPGPITDNSDTKDFPIYFEAKFENNKWVMLAVKDIPIQ